MRYLGMLLAFMLAVYSPAAIACEKMDVMRVMVWPLNFGDVPVWYANEKGLFAAECLTVELTENQNAAEHQSSLSNGAVDALTNTTVVERTLLGGSTNLGNPVIVRSLADGSAYVLVGLVPVLPDGARAEPSLHDLLGERVAVYQCSWQGLGDITDVVTRPPEAQSGSVLTDMLVVFLREKMASGALPSDTRIYCGEPASERDGHTIYLSEVGGSGKRFAELLQAQERPTEDRIAFGMITVPKHLKLVSVVDGESAYDVYGRSDEFLISDGYLVVMSGKLRDDSFRDVLSRFAAAHTRAVAELQRDPAMAAAYMMDLVARKPDTITFATETDAEVAANIGKTLWQSSCPSDAATEAYIAASGLTGIVGVGDIVDCVLP